MKQSKAIQIIELNDQSWFVRCRSDKQTKQQIQDRAVTRADSDSHSREAWKAIRDMGIKSIIMPTGFERLNAKDADIAKKSWIEAAKLLGKTVRNNPRTSEALYYKEKLKVE